MQTNIFKYQLFAKSLALILILYANLCFYKIDTQIVYLVMLGTAGLLVLFSTRFKLGAVSKTIIWLTIVFLMFIVSGELFLVTGIFNTDRFIISYFQCILFYFIFKTFADQKDCGKVLFSTFGIAAVLCILTIYLQEGSFIGREIRTVGNTMSGNVNTVGMCLGVMSLFIAYYLGKTKNIFVLLLLIAVTAVMLLTGSKKTIIYIIANIFIIYSQSKNKTRGKITFIILLSLVFYIVFGIDYFYNAIGSRIIDMLGQMGFHIENAQYSYSTEIRIEMIGEAFSLWLKNPIFGGGTNYFQAHTVTIYEYSHCNVTEILCSFGIVGLLIYYIPYFIFLKNYRRLALNNKNLFRFCLIIMLMSLVIDWMAGTYSSFATMYIPAIFGLVINEKYDEKLENDVLHDSSLNYIRTRKAL